MHIKVVPDLAVLLMYLPYALGHYTEALLAYAPFPLKWQFSLEHGSLQ